MPALQVAPGTLLRAVCLQIAANIGKCGRFTKRPYSAQLYQTQ